MPAYIALFICTLVILILLYLDGKWNENLTFALWIPLIWIGISGSRSLSLFFGSSSYGGIAPEDYLEGSPTDRIIFTALIIMGLAVLIKRNINVANVFNKNKWLSLLVIYCGISILWSDFPYVSFKRYTKSIGNVIMILVVVTDKYSDQVIKTILRRLAYILIPLSYVFIKYFPKIGRNYHRYSGELSITGVTTNKNGLGVLCMILGLYFTWNLFLNKDNKLNNQINDGKLPKILNIIFTVFIIDLLLKSNSATSIYCYLLGLLFMFYYKYFDNLNPINNLFMTIFPYVFFVVTPLLVIAKNIFHDVVSISGHSETFWGRVSFWPELTGISDGSVLVGTGYDSFWLGNKMQILWERYWWHPTQAHNGYVDTYLELGIIGVIIFFVFIVRSYKDIVLISNKNDSFWLFKIAVFNVTLVYNITESAFKGISLIWIVFLLVLFNYNKIIDYNVVIK